jgi:hypothetical protein
MKGLPGGRKVVVLMALSNDQTRIREFLLGKLSEDEQQKIEERLLTEDDLFEELEVTKGELVEEYNANDLTRQEREWFERTFLASPEGKERYAFVTALDRLKRNTPAPPSPPSFFERIKNFFKQHPPKIAIASAAAVIVIVAGLFLSLPTGGTYVGPQLASSLINRDQGNLPAKITIPTNTSEVRFRLLLPQGTSPNANYRATLDNRSETEPVKVVEHDSEGVWVVIPARLLPRGEYSLQLVAITGGTEREIPGYYLFNVE